MNKYILCLMLCFSLSTLCASEKIYIDKKELSQIGDSFHIHVGHNIWLVTDTIHKDCSGLYTLESRLLRAQKNNEGYVRHWKCPYCYMYWDVGTRCQNKECPAKY